MSHPLLPKNLLKTLALFRIGPADYVKLLAEAFPAPTVAEEGARLKVTDTGDVYTWTGTTWIQTNFFGLPLLVEKSDRGGFSHPVILQDQTTGVLPLPFLRNLGTVISLAADTVVNVNTITLTAGHGLTTGANAGQYIEIASDTNGSHFMQSQIVTVTINTILLDSPVPRVFTPGGSTLVHSSRSMNVDGSITPVVFAIEPLPIQSGDITRTICDIRDNVAMDFETFGGLAALTNGLVLRVNNGDGTYRILYNFKSNGDIIGHCFDNNFATNNGGGTRGFTSRLTWASQGKYGVAIRLDGAVGTGEKLEWVVQDDLTGLLQMHWNIGGSELQGE